MNLINVTDRLPPTPAPGEIVGYPVVYLPSEGGYHRGLMDGVGWDGKQWLHFGDWSDEADGTPLSDGTGTVVQWADPIAPVITAAPPPAPTGPAVEDPDSTFTVTLTSAGPTKMGVIKVVREVTGLSLMDSKTLVEAAPKPVKMGVNRAEADGLQAKIVAAGGTATIERES